MVKNLPARQETPVQSLCWDDPLEKGLDTHSSFFPGEFHGQRSLVSCSPQGRKESGVTEQLALRRSELREGHGAEWSLFSANEKWGTWKGFHA